MSLLLDEIVLTGVSICKGIAIGRLFLLAADTSDIPHIGIQTTDLDKEVSRFYQAVKKTKQEISLLKKQLKKEHLKDAALILDAHLQMMKDPRLGEEIEEQIRNQKRNAEWVLSETLESLRKKFNAISDPYFRERMHDIEDIGQRIMSHLMARHVGALKDIPPGSVVFARDLTPSLVAEAIQNQVVALISETGGPTSHAAIVARAKGLPYISSVSYGAIQDFFNELLIVDSRQGALIVRPAAETLERYERDQQVFISAATLSDSLGALAIETLDGHAVRLSANIDADSGLEVLHEWGASGVGLYRSEFIFLNRPKIPSEEEQYLTYCNIIEKLKGLPLVIRTFDIGGDKTFASKSAPKGKNPFLGCRAIRFLLKEKDIFLTQIRAILRAGQNRAVSIMFPMVSSLSELLLAKEVVLQAERELQQEKIPFQKKIRIGCMIEVPSAALIADLLAKECDFLSIGTNDLVQYSLAVDRSDESLSEFYTPAHPGILRLIRMTALAAKKAKIPVSVCGEVAADPHFVPLLLGLGIEELSVAPRFLPDIKRAIRSISFSDAEKLALKALSLTTAQEIEALLEREYASKN